MTIQLVHKGRPILFDSSDWAIIAPYKWRIEVLGYAVAFIDGKIKKMHRLILGLNDPKIFTDHINHNRIDNRRENIRSCSQADNARNVSAHGRSKYLGVSYQVISYKCLLTDRIRTYEYIKAKIRVDNKLLHLGTFKTEQDAALAYNEAAKKYFGEFANLNVV